MGRMVRPSTTSEKKWWYACRPYEMKEEGAMWHVEPLLGNDHEISKYTRAVTG
jgi:hypothetical protein